MSGGIHATSEAKPLAEEVMTVDYILLMRHAEHRRKGIVNRPDLVRLRSSGTLRLRSEYWRIASALRVRN